MYVLAVCCYRKTRFVLFDVVVVVAVVVVVYGGFDASTGNPLRVADVVWVSCSPDCPDA